jgi:hypothetical protein
MSAAVVPFYAKVQLETHWLCRFSHSSGLRPSASHAWTTNLQFLEQYSSIFLSFFMMTLPVGWNVNLLLSFAHPNFSALVKSHPNRWLCKEAMFKAHEARGVRRTSCTPQRQSAAGGKRNAEIGLFTKPSIFRTFRKDIRNPD